MTSKPDNLILFDNRCNLCAGVVRFILKKDKEDKFRFGSLYSNEGKKIKKSLSFSQQKNSILYFQNGVVYIQSDAALQVLIRIGGFYKSFIFFLWINKKFRDYLYNLIAKYRYLIFGKRKLPFIPPKEHQWKFIEYDNKTTGTSK